MHRRISILIVGALAALPATAQLSPGAARVLGQSDLRQTGINGVEGAEFFNPSGAALDRRGAETRLYVADAANNRVLGWRDATSVESGARADLVLGQPSFRHSTPRGIGARGLNNPLSLTVDPTTGDLYVSDSGDHRILRFDDPFSNPDRVEPSVVIGQPDFQTFAANTGGVSALSLNTPLGLRFDSTGALWVADSGNHRLLRYPASQLTASRPEADLVIGQPNFTSSGTNFSEGGAPNERGFSTPTALDFHPDGRLYVADLNNLRVTVFDRPFQTAAAAARVIGQPDLRTRLVPQTATASSLRGPNALAIDGSGTLYVVTGGDHRVMVFPDVASAGPTPDAARSIGQATPAGAVPNVGTFPRASENGLFGAGDVAVDAQRNVYVVDSANHRIVRFGPNSQQAALVLGQAGFSENGPNRVGGGSLGAAFDVVIDYSQTPFPIYISDTPNNRVLGWRSSLRFRNGDPAELVIGQADFTTAVANSDTGQAQSPTRTSLAGPRGLTVNEQGDLFVADSLNNRVLRFRAPFQQQGRVTADLVLGQPGFVSALSAAVTPRSLNRPSDAALGPNGEIFVSDTLNNRVVEYPPNPPNGADAVRVFGQPAFDTRAGFASVSAQSLIGPEGLHVDAAGFLYVADRGTNRVVLYPLSPDAETTGVSASKVIGQDSFEMGASRTGAAGLASPRQVTTAPDGAIYVADADNNRVVRFEQALLLPNVGATATGALGQPSLTGRNPNFNSADGLATPEGLFSPAALFADRNGTLYVGDTGNNRVVHFLRVTGMLNAAAFQVGAPTAPGSLVSLFGIDLTGEQAQADAVPLPRQLAGRRVEVNGEFEAALLFASPEQFNLQLPVETPIGLQHVVMRLSDTDEPLAGGPIVVAPEGPGLFTVDQNGRGRALAINQDGTINGPENPAPRGSVVQFFGTGQGATNPIVATGQPAPASPLAETTAPPRATLTECASPAPGVCAAVGAKSAQVMFSGLAPGFVGLWQLNVRIPDGEDVLTGAEIPVSIILNRRGANNVTIAIQ